MLVDTMGLTDLDVDEARRGEQSFELCARQPAMGDAVKRTVSELLPTVADSLEPPEGAGESVLGASADDLRSFALDGLKRRLTIIGVSLG